MGVLNVTPDSFSDGGRWLDAGAAIAHGLAMVGEGADVVDVGGESTRPGAAEVPLEEELRRVLPVVDALAGRVRVSIDTRKRAVAEAALDAGATIVNDVSADLYDVAAVHGAGWVAMHMRGTPLTMQQEATYDDVVSEVREFLLHRVQLALAAGVAEVWIDPGLGFAKTADHNLALLARLDELVATGHPVLIGASRKSFIGRLTGDAPVDDRLAGSLALAVWAMEKGAAMVRVHDVQATVQAARLVTCSMSDVA
jgi:dihydropteroate synthase